MRLLRLPSLKPIRTDNVASSSSVKQPRLLKHSSSNVSVKMSWHSCEPRRSDWRAFDRRRRRNAASATWVHGACRITSYACRAPHLDCADCRQLSVQFGFLNISSTLDSSATSDFQQETMLPLEGASVSKGVDTDGKTRITVAYTSKDNGERERIVIEPIQEDADTVYASLQESIIAAQELEAQWLTRFVVVLSFQVMF